MQEMVLGKPKFTWTYEPGETHPGQQEGFLHIYHQQKEDEGKCRPVADQSRRTGDKEHGKDWGTQHLIHFGLY